MEDNLSDISQNQLDKLFTIHYNDLFSKFLTMPYQDLFAMIKKQVFFFF